MSRTAEKHMNTLLQVQAHIKLIIKLKNVKYV